jgi:replicative DNA helicase
VIVLQDFETWTQLRKSYLPAEYHSIYNAIDHHCDKFHSMPTFEDLKLSIRDNSTKEKLCAVEPLEVEADASMLLEFLKNEYAQKEILDALELYVENTVAFADASESIGELHQIILDVENKVDLTDPSESMQSIELWDSDEELSRYVPLGFNTEYDNEYQFSPTDLILVGGKRGSGKSITCSNIAHSVLESGKSAMYFTIEMPSRQILQRACSIATGVPHSRLRMKNLSVTEWGTVAEWWAKRFDGGEERLKEYQSHRDFDKFHHKLKTKHELLPTHQLDIIYDPGLTLSTIQAELDKKVGVIKPGIIIVDYLNQLRRSTSPSRGGQYEWTEQIELSKALKKIAQDYEVPVYAPFQTDDGGNARFAKGILDAPDAVYTLETWEPQDACITFNCAKMRNQAVKGFTSVIDWECIKIGPDVAVPPPERGEQGEKTGEEIDDPF